MVDNHQECDSNDSQENENDNQSSAAECTDFSAKLKELQAEMEQDAADLEYQKRKQVNSAADFKELEKIIGEIDTIVSTYSNARGDLKKGLEKHENYCCTKKEMIDAAVGDKKCKLDIDIEACKTNIETLKSNVATKKGNKCAAETCLKASQKTLDFKTTCFNQWKERKKDTEKIITSLNELQDQIEQKESESKFAVMYYLITNFCDALSDFKDGKENCKIDPPIVEDDDAFKNGLKAAWCEMHEAKRDVLNKQDAFDEAARILETVENNLLTAEEQLVSNIIQKMEEIDINCTCS